VLFGFFVGLLLERTGDLGMFAPNWAFP